MTDHDLIDLGLNVGAALFAVVAAFFWFVSAGGKMPRPDTTFDGFLKTPEEIISTMKYSARWNRLAALFAGFSALLTAAAIARGICR